MTTFILAGVVALMTAHFLRQNRTLQHASDQVDPVAKKTVAANVSSPGVVVGNQPDPSIPVVVGPASSSDEPLSNRISTEAEPQEPPASSSSSPARSEPVRQPAAAPSDAMGRTIVIIFAITAVAVVAPLVFAFCFFTLLRRHLERFGALIQVNNTIPPQIDIGPLLAARLAVPQAFPAAVESRHIPDEMPSPAGDALFEHMFVETLELQTQLDRVQQKELHRGGKPA
jgi:hypothetical protein